MSLKKQSLYNFGEFSLDTSERQLRRGTEVISIQPKAFETLCLLVENHGKLMSKDFLMNELWADTFVEERNLAQNIFTLRKILGGKKKGKKFIETVPKAGYRFVAEVRPIEFVEEEIVEISLANQTTIKAEGNISSNDLASVIRTTAESLAIDQNQVEARIKQVPESGLFSQNSLLTIFAISILSVFTIGAGYWFWSPSTANNQISNENRGFSPESINFDRLTDSGNAFYPAISRDKQNVAYVAMDGEKYSLVLQHISTKSTAIVVEPQEWEIRSINFSADGDYIYYILRDPAQQGSTAYQVPIYGGAQRKILSNIRHLFSISTDGEKIAFFRYDPQKDVIHLMTSSIGGTDEKIVSTRKAPEQFMVWDTFPAWSPDDKKIVVSGFTREFKKENNDDKNYLIEIDVATGEQKILKTPDLALPLQAVWLKDGNGLVVLAQDELKNPNQLWHLDISTGQVKRITNDTNNYLMFHLSFDASTIIAMNLQMPANLFLVDLEDPRQIEQLTQGTTDSKGIKGLAWTTDSESLIYVRSENASDGDLWKINVKDRLPHQLTFDEDRSIVKPKSLPGGKDLIFSSNRSGKWQIWKINTDGTGLELVNNFVGTRDPEVSPDGKWLIYSTPAGNPSELRRMPLNGGESTRILNHAAGQHRFSPSDPNHIITEYHDPQEKDNGAVKVVIFSTADGAISEDLSFAGMRYAFDWASDGRGIYFLRAGLRENNVWYLSLEDKSITQVTDLKDMRIRNLTVSPDGKTLAISSEEVTSNILTISGF